MHNDTTNEEILKRYNSLPADLKEAMSSDENTGKLTVIGKKHGLMIDKIGQLGDETGSVMLGITPPGEYVRNLVSKLGVDREKARAIAEDINLEIFRPIRESLKKVHNIKEVEKKTEPEGEIIRPDIMMPEKIEKPKIPPLFAKKIPIGEEMKNEKLEVRKEKLEVKAEKPQEEKSAAGKIEIPKPLANLPPEPEINPLDHEAVKAAMEKSLGGEIRTGAPAPPPQSAKRYIEQDPYREPI